MSVMVHMSMSIIEKQQPANNMTQLKI